LVKGKYTRPGIAGNDYSGPVNKAELTSIPVYHSLPGFFMAETINPQDFPYIFDGLNE
jgi:hypothetical protein